VATSRLKILGPAGPADPRLRRDLEHPDHPGRVVLHVGRARVRLPGSDHVGQDQHLDGLLAVGVGKPLVPGDPLTPVARRVQHARLSGRLGSDRHPGRVILVGLHQHRARASDQRIGLHQLGVGVHLVRLPDQPGQVGARAEAEPGHAQPLGHRVDHQLRPVGLRLAQELAERLPLLGVQQRQHVGLAVVVRLIAAHLLGLPVELAGRGGPQIIQLGHGPQPTPQNPAAA
jgi:hypothetical protein